MSVFYDYDVVVVGAGFVGMVVVIWVRWVKGYYVLVGFVCLVELGVFGGLLCWGFCVLIGLGWFYLGVDLMDILMKDVE